MIKFDSYCPREGFSWETMVLLNDIGWAFGSIESLVLDVDNSVAEKRLQIFERGDISEEGGLLFNTGERIYLLLQNMYQKQCLLQKTLFQFEFIYCKAINPIPQHFCCLLCLTIKWLVCY